MTERSQRHVQRTPSRLQVGKSAMQWHDGELVVELDEVANPLPRRVRGTVRVRPQGLSRFSAALDDDGRHRWGPIAPCARVQVDFEAPGLSWQGHAYVDSNEGDEPVSEPFTTWDWMRAPLQDGSTVVVYDVQQKGGRADRTIGTRFWPDVTHAAVELPPRRSLNRTGWGVSRTVRCDSGGRLPVAEPRLVRTLEDTPFYARSVVQTQLCGQTVTAMHETLSATRFASPLVQALLPFRMPRRA